MAGRAGRPDFHDLGKVVLLAEPGGSYSRENPYTEEEVAMRLLKGEMEEVAPVHDLEQSSEEYVANAVACGGEEADLARINTMMVGSLEPVLPELVAHRLVQKKGTKIELSPLARVMSEHFIGIERLLEIMRLVGEMDNPLDIIAELGERGDGKGGDAEERERREAARAKERTRETVNGQNGAGCLPAGLNRDFFQALPRHRWR